jgi:NADPH:quinone reductase-like Zn-dependent oxidoreductase
MKAMVYEKYGPPGVLQLKELEKPAPKEIEALIKIHATTVTKYDCWVRSCTAPPGFGLLMRIASGRKPKQSILGIELAGKSKRWVKMVPDLRWVTRFMVARG